jgi:hypothetical protein
MTINNIETFIMALWDWAFLNVCFRPTKIRVSDIDGVVERKGRFLFLETKPWDKEVSRGQQIMFDGLSRLPGVDVLVIWGKPNEPQAMQHWGETDVLMADEKAVISFVRNWFLRANQARGANRNGSNKWR